MCDPVTLGTMALTAGGSIVNGMEANANARRQAEARNKAAEAELARQRGYQTESNTIFDTSLGAFSPQVQQSRLADAKAGANTFFSANAPLNVGSISTGNAPAAVKAAEAKTIADVFAENAGKTEALGNLTGWDQYGFDNRVGLAEGARGLGTVSDVAGNSARVNALEQNVAYNNAYRPPSGLGDILSFAGTALGLKAPTTLPTKPAIGAPINLLPLAARP